MTRRETTGLDCRVCGTETKVILNLGQSPLANGLLNCPDDVPKQYPLGLCECRKCGLVQNITNLGTDDLFDHEYPYYSGVSLAVRRHASELACQIAQHVGPGSLVLEIGSNDGTTQRALAAQGLRSVGVDPAAGPVAKAIDAGCAAYCGVLDDAMIALIEDAHGPVDAVTMSNVFAHLPDPAGLLAQIRKILRPDGLLVIEVQSWLDLVASGSFDMVYHEHHSHFSLSSISNTLFRSGFGVRGVQKVAAQGGSLRVFCRMDIDHGKGIDAQIGTEAELIAAAPERLRKKVIEFQSSAAKFASLVSERDLAGYGAAAKTVSLLAALDVPLRLTCIADAAPSKIGKFLPHGGIPIVSPAEMLRREPSSIILFAHNLRREIMPKLTGHDVWVPLPVFEKIT